MALTSAQKKKLEKAGASKKQIDAVSGFLKKPTTPSSKVTTPVSSYSEGTRAAVEAKGGRVSTVGSYDEGTRARSEALGGRAASATPSSLYSGSSVVDYLGSTGRASDFNSRAQLARDSGIANYTGTDAQNIQLLNSLRGGSSTATSTSTAATTTPAANKTAAEFNYDAYIDKPDKTIADQEEIIRKLKEEAARPETDAQARDRITALFQREIDALNAAYAQQKIDATKAGLANLGSNRASQARFGLLGSTFGAAETSNINQQTEDEKKKIDVANQAALAPVYNEITKQLLQSRKDKETARLSSAEDYLAQLRNSKEEKKSIATNAVRSMILNDANPTDKDLEKMAKQIGIDASILKREYLEAKKVEDAEAASLVNEKEKTSLALLKQRADISRPQDVGDYTYIFNKETGKWENAGLNKTATATNGIGDMNNKQITVYNRIMDKSNAINSANATFNVAKATAERLKANPHDPQNQLSNLYQYVKTLDSNSAVREGEIGLATATGSFLENIQQLIQSYKDGSVVGSDLAVEMADEAIALADAWLRESEIQKNDLRAQARTNGIEDEYTSTIDYARELNKDIGKRTIEDYRAEFPQATDEELQALLEEESN